MKLKELKNKKILILGFGREGVDTFKFLRKIFPNKIFGIADKLPLEKLNPTAKKLISHIFHGREKCGIKKKVKFHLGEDYLKALKDYDVIVKSPGIPIHLPEIEKAFKEGKITSQTEIFFENCPGKIIGITGTKGKGTTSSLIYQILKEGKIKCHLIGNIGKPVLQLLLSAKPNDIYVYELSSHQLYNLKKSPHIAVFLNIYPDHLDYYRNFKEYINTKANIAKYQTKNDYLVYNFEDKIVREIAKKSKAKKIPITQKIPVEFLSTWRKSQLKERVNVLNVAAAIAVGKIFGILNKIIKEVIKNFKPLPHRLELVGNFKGITFYNDALASIPDATINALNILGNKVETIILGGSEKNLDFMNLAKKILKTKIKTVILFPTTGERIWKTIQRVSLAQGKKLPRHFFVDNMPEAVKLAYQYTQKGKICLLSTASPSFSLFRDYREKGNLFKKYVKKFAKSKK